MSGLGQRLPGGWMSGSRLVDGRVRRAVGAHTPFVHRLLHHLEQAGFEGAPRVLGVEGDEEVLTYLQGHVPVETRPEDIQEVVFSDRGVGSAFALVRRYHDLTAGTALAGAQEVVCHGDLSPWNTVYDDQGATAFIDWDAAAPGSRCDDVGYAAWRFLMLGFPGAPPLATQARWLRLVVDAYGRFTAAEVLDLVAAAQEHERCAFERRRADGDHRYRRQLELGAVRIITDAQRWLVDQRQALLA